MSYFTSAGDTLVSRRGYGGPTPTGLSGVLETIGGFVKDGVSAAVDIYNSGQKAAGGQAALQQVVAQQQPAPRSGMPTWVMPAAVLGGAGLLAFVVLNKKRKNPSRGKGRSHIVKRLTTPTADGAWGRRARGTRRLPGTSLAGWKRR